MSNGDQKVAIIEEESAASLLLEIYYDEQLLATGTAFLFAFNNKTYLITNRHNATGLNQQTGKPLSRHGGIPDRFVISHRSALGVQYEHPMEILLRDADGSPVWLEHPIFGPAVDVIALPMTLAAPQRALPYSIDRHSIPVRVGPSDVVSVVGYPFGVKSGGLFAVWVTGFVATEPAVDHNEYPTFLIDCRTRTGMSGSPVIAHRSGGMVAMERGDSSVFNRPVTRLMGVYSGRINAESDLGIVWKTTCIVDVVRGAESSQ